MLLDAARTRPERSHHICTGTRDTTRARVRKRGSNMRARIL